MLLEPGHSHDSATKIALVLYAGYNLAATLVAVPGGHLTDRRGSVLVLILGSVAFAACFAGFAFAGSSIAVLALLFALGGIGIGVGETAQSAAVAVFAPERDPRLGVRARRRCSGAGELRLERRLGADLHGRVAEGGVSLSRRLERRRGRRLRARSRRRSLIPTPTRGSRP